MTNFSKINYHAHRIGYYADKYFLRTQEILIKDKYEGIVHYQYFPRKDCIVCGIDHVIQLLKNCIGYYKDRDLAWELFKEMQAIDIYNCSDDELKQFKLLKDQLENLWVSEYHSCKVFAVKEGSHVKNMEPVIGIIGNPKYFIHLETATLGVLAQQSAVATSVRRVIDNLNENQTMLFFPARFRHYNSQAPDGYAASIGGGKLMSTDANGEYWGYNGIGTIPHALIAAYGGNTAYAAYKFDEMIDPSISRTILVDWDNDCIKTTLEVILMMINVSLYTLETSIKNSCLLNREKPRYTLEKLCRDYSHIIPTVIGEGKGKIAGVRFDTSGSQTDFGINQWGEKGVCKELVYTARKVFDELNMKDLKIIVSGGFDDAKIGEFKNVPYDMVGIGSSIVNKFTVDFTADAVMLNGLANAKIGRKLMDWTNLCKI